MPGPGVAVRLGDEDGVASGVRVASGTGEGVRVGVALGVGSGFGETEGEGLGSAVSVTVATRLKLEPLALVAVSRYCPSVAGERVAVVAPSTSTHAPSKRCHCSVSPSVTSAVSRAEEGGAVTLAGWAAIVGGWAHVGVTSPVARAVP